MKDIKIHYEKYLPSKSTNEDIWFEINKIPLKWNIPFGALLDSIMQNKYELPINIVVHFSSLDEEKVLRFKKADSLKNNYLNSLKESMTLKYGSNEKILNLPTKETNKLLDIITNNGNKLLREFNILNRTHFDNDINLIR